MHPILLIHTFLQIILEKWRWNSLYKYWLPQLLIQSIFMCEPMCLVCVYNVYKFTLFDILNSSVKNSPNMRKHVFEDHQLNFMKNVFLNKIFNEKLLLKIRKSASGLFLFYCYYYSYVFLIMSLNRTSHLNVSFL